MRVATFVCRKSNSHSHTYQTSRLNMPDSFQDEIFEKQESLKRTYVANLTCYTSVYVERLSDCKLIILKFSNLFLCNISSSKYSSCTRIVLHDVKLPSLFFCLYFLNVPYYIVFKEPSSVTIFPWQHIISVVEKQ